MASKETNQISIRLDDDVNGLVEQLRQIAIEEKLKIREEVGAVGLPCSRSYSSGPASCLIFSFLASTRCISASSSTLISGSSLMFSWFLSEDLLIGLQ